MEQAFVSYRTVEFPLSAESGKRTPIKSTVQPKLRRPRNPSREGARGKWRWKTRWKHSANVGDSRLSPQSRFITAGVHSDLNRCTRTTRRKSCAARLMMATPRKLQSSHLRGTNLDRLFRPLLIRPDYVWSACANCGRFLDLERSRFSVPLPARLGVLATRRRSRRRTG